MFRNQGLVRETAPLSFISSSALISNATLIIALLEKNAGTIVINMPEIRALNL